MDVKKLTNRELWAANIVARQTGNRDQVKETGAELMRRTPRAA
jgi:hypothetical protein